MKRTVADILREKNDPGHYRIALPPVLCLLIRESKYPTEVLTWAYYQFIERYGPMPESVVNAIIADDGGQCGIKWLKFPWRKECPPHDLSGLLTKMGYPIESIWQRNGKFIATALVGGATGLGVAVWAIPEALGGSVGDLIINGYRYLTNGN